jgi:hypothetical protein
MIRNEIETKIRLIKTIDWYSAVVQSGWVEWSPEPFDEQENKVSRSPAKDPLFQIVSLDIRQSICSDINTTVIEHVERDAFKICNFAL